MIVLHFHHVGQFPDKHLLQLGAHRRHQLLDQPSGTMVKQIVLISPLQTLVTLLRYSLCSPAPSATTKVGGTGNVMRCFLLFFLSVSVNKIMPEEQIETFSLLTG